jgi:hypothetical protein
MAAISAGSGPVIRLFFRTTEICVTLFAPLIGMRIYCPTTEAFCERTKISLQVLNMKLIFSLTEDGHRICGRNSFCF